MGAPVQNQAQSSMGMQATLPEQPTLSTGNQSNDGNQYPIQQGQSMPDLPMGKGNVTNSATSGQPMMGMPNNNTDQFGLNNIQR
jgi:hypothetical protein